MSNYWGYVCLSHDPPMYSEQWLNHGEEALRAAWEQSRTPEGWPAVPKIPGVNDLLGDDPMPIDHRGVPHSGPGGWLWEHPRCRVGLHDQRSALIELNPVTEPPEPPMTTHPGDEPSSSYQRPTGMNPTYSDPQRRYTLTEARALLAREQCDTDGHDLEATVVRRVDGTVIRHLIYCARCSATFTEDTP